jgi:medium-chain acyl-[acyl-carrier-protein] hydrolase
MTAEEINSWLAPPRLNLPSELNLFCFPYAGGGASIFHTWQQYLPPTIEVRAVHLPGRDSRLQDAPITRMAVMVERFVQALLPELEKPFALFGHSMGAAIIFEVARYLRREQGIGPAHLFVSAHPAPQLIREESSTYNLPDDEFINVIRRFHGTLDGVADTPELMQLMLPLLRADFALCDKHTYVEDAPLDCPITALGGLEDRAITRGQLASWREQTNSSFNLRMFPGNHFFIRTAASPALRMISKELQRFLSVASRGAIS